MKLHHGLKPALYNYSIQLEQGKETTPVTFKKHKSTERDLFVFYSQQLELVLKRQGFIMEPRTPQFLRIPTMRIREGWVAQPIAKKIDLKKAVDIIKEKLQPYYAIGIYPDVHVYNVGWYEENPVLFDW
jgi:hypothetical protein